MILGKILLDPVVDPVVHNDASESFTIPQVLGRRDFSSKVFVATGTWGFYFVACKDANGIGARDLESAIQLMSRWPKWEKDAFSSKRAIEANVAIASDRVFEVLSARWHVSKLFIEVATNLNGGNPDANTQ